MNDNALLWWCAATASASALVTLSLLTTSAGAQTPAGQDTISGTQKMLPDLFVDGVLIGSEVVRAGEKLTVIARIGNDGDAPAEDVVARACNADGLCGKCILPQVLDGGEPGRCDIAIQAGAEDVARNPHYWMLTVDPDEKLPELDESNNVGESPPTFIVAPKLPARPGPIHEEDEFVVFRNGKVLAVDRIDYGPDGAPGRNEGTPGTSKPAPDDDHGDLKEIGEKPERPQEMIPIFVDPRVRREAEAAGPSGRIQAIIQFAGSDEAFPRLPDLDPMQPRLSRRNARILTERMAILEGVGDQRRRAMAPLTRTVEEAGGRILETFVLGFAFRAEFPVPMLDHLARDNRVRSIEPVIGGERPPSHDEVDDARDLIESDVYFNSGATGAGWSVALLDSGLRSTHTLFTSPDHIDLFRDCVNGNSFCLDDGDPAYDPSDDCHNHGTSSAGIITGNSNLGSAFRGVTDASLDSFKVYPENCGGLDYGAVLRGFDRAVFWGNKVIVAEMQALQSHTGSIADAADDAFDSGSLVIGANGNNGPGAATVNSPANAHKTIGIGAYDLVELLGLSFQSRGPTGDGRIKPDVRFPNNSETASGASDTATRNFGGTSGATPYGGAASILLVDWAQSIGWNTTDPGLFYVMLIAFGDKEYNNIDNISGAGDTVLGTNGSSRRGTRTVTNNDWDYEPFTVDAGDSCINAAIWWGEGVTWHNDIDLYLYDPSGTQRHHSVMVDSVFETVELHSNLTPGTWEIGIHGYGVKALASPQTVYYFVRVCD